MARPAAAALIMHFLCYVKVARVAHMARYMERQWGYPIGTTRNTIVKLAREGKIERVGYGRYALTDRRRAG